MTHIEDQPNKLSRRQDLLKVCIPAFAFLALGVGMGAVAQHGLDTAPFPSSPKTGEAGFTDSWLIDPLADVLGDAERAVGIHVGTDSLPQHAVTPNTK